MAKKAHSGPSGLVVVDKPAGITSHDVVSQLRRLAQTRKVGHAGTLDPMATGVLILGIGKATKLLTYIVGESKTYTATMRLGQATVTDDAEGEFTALASADAVAAVTESQIAEHVAELTGDIMQVPSSVSAIKVNGVRSYAKVRGGEEVKLEPRPVTISEFSVHSIDRVETPQGAAIDCRVTVSCSSGTYIRALARDLGEKLGIGGHLTALRRTRIGEITEEKALTLEALEALKGELGELPMLSLEDAATRLFAVRQLTAAEATDLSNGRRITHNPTGAQSPEADQPSDAVHAAYAPDGRLVALTKNTTFRGSYLAAPELVFEAGQTFGETE
ncbi:tRNA pseudouridine(55) synthase TruB [Rothia aerolata]|uniref:tRNA pseudouridine synthase B n=1 Tax=Rothia aerolata TaxID=1812262 RepID=A0A917MTQ5_9MICC|nr:tRNA pseudouridine(55) synthase TruB [Rothia aerolata]GGH63519.1 tRNA pseudouridine synthase B [Rothia aerolata]